VIKNKNIILAFVMGLILGMNLDKMTEEDQQSKNDLSEIKPELKIKQRPASNVDNKHQQKLESLEARVAELTEKLNTAQEKLANKKPGLNLKKPVQVKVLTISTLVAAGIDEAMAEEIIRRKDEAEYWYLELRDRAVREGYLSTPRFRKEIRQLKYDDVNMRNDLGDDVYDRYLYAAGKDNRVAVSSIMKSSPAEYTGIMAGDIILSYDEQKIFSWQELSKATTQGRRDESVIVNVQRNSEILNILVPRGPLGVKLEARHIQP